MPDHDYVQSCSCVSKTNVQNSKMVLLDEDRSKHFEQSVPALVLRKTEGERSGSSGPWQIENLRESWH